MSKRFRFALILGIMALCFVFLLPSIRWYFWTPVQDQVRALAPREQIRAYATERANTQLEYLIYQARIGGDLPEELSFLIPQARSIYRSTRQPIPGTWDAAAVLRAFTRQEALTAIEAHHREEIFALRNLHRNAVQLGLDLSGGLSIVLQADMDALQERLGRSVTDADREDAMERALDVLNSRIDRFGLTEPVIRRQGAEQIYVEIPGTADPERINDIIMGRGSLNFHIVDNHQTDIFNAAFNANPGATVDVHGNLLNPALLHPDVVLRGVFDRDEYGLDIQRRNAAGNPMFVALRREIGLDGNHIQSAEVRQNPDPTQRNPIVAFNLDSEGGDIFHRLTSANVGNPLALVLEDRVRAVATIQVPIWDQVSLTGFPADEARNIALMLRTAALPVELEVVSQQNIGASLGEDTIRRGLNALLLGVALVLAFMLMYYKAAGINAVVAQLLNFYIMFSVLSAFNFTLTLPAIAGFILTIGMATDASVIIFERMKEELRLGKGRKAAIELGFGKAFWAIMDSNITTFIAALFLSQLGTGPIRGFAVALAIGVFSSVFTALFVSRLIFDFGTDVLKSKNLAISWFPIRAESEPVKGIG
ncbi:MAG: protein translocase subunit SecD [Treponema sp.]|nr:protein translocase subunit SecD [Treponema sp.]